MGVFRLNHSFRRFSGYLKRMLVRAAFTCLHKSARVSFHLCQVSVGRWSSDADAVDVNKLFRITYGCFPLFLLRTCFCSYKRCLVSHGCQVISIWYCGHLWNVFCVQTVFRPLWPSITSESFLFNFCKSSCINLNQCLYKIKTIWCF